RNKHRLDSRERRPRGRNNHADIIHGKWVIRLVKAVPKHVGGIFLPWAVGAEPGDHIDHVAVALLAPEDRLILLQRVIHLFPDIRWVSLALSGEEIGQVAESLTDRRISGEERALCSHNAENLLGQHTLASIARKRRQITHDRCSSASTSSRNISMYFSVSQAM